MSLAYVKVSNHVPLPCCDPYCLCLLATCVSLLPPATSSMSCKQAPCLHCPGITLWLSSSSSARPWWIPGYLNPMMLCNVQQTNTIEVTVSRFWLMVVRRRPNLLAMMPKAFSTTLLAWASLKLKILSSSGSPLALNGFINQVLREKASSWMRKYGISWSSPGSGSASGISKVPSTMP